MSKKSDLQRTLRMLGKNFEENFDEDMNADDQTPVETTASRGRNGVTKHISAQGGNNVSQSLIAESVGDLNVTVSRNAANIATPLPFIVFGQNDFAAKYINTLQGLMQPVIAFNATTVVAVTEVAGNVVFTYTAAGPLVDVVTVALLGNISYIGFLAAMSQNLFKYRMAEISISDEAQNLIQFSQPVTFGELSALGRLSSDQVVLRSRINSMTFRKDRVELIVPEQPVTPSYAFASYIAPTAGFSVGLDFFMSWRLNMNKV